MIPFSAPLIKSKKSSIEYLSLKDDFTNVSFIFEATPKSNVIKLESEISSFSSIHQTIDGNYRNVQKIMRAFKNLLSDPNKPRKVVIYLTIFNFQ